MPVAVVDGCVLARQENKSPPGDREGYLMLRWMAVCLVSARSGDDYGSDTRNVDQETGRLVHGTVY